MTTYPCQSETFAAREIDALRQSGLDISVCAARPGTWSSSGREGVDITYRPRFYSLENVRGIIHCLRRYPSGTLRLGFLMLRLLFVCPRESLTLARNLHAVMAFARHLDVAKCIRIHAYFLSWPALMGLGMTVLTRCRFSIGAHARDIFVEAGALEWKVRSAQFVASCTQQGLRALQARLPRELHDKLHIVHHCIPDSDREFPPTGQSHEVADHDLISVGRFVEKKGYGYLLMAVALLKERRLLVTLCMAGEGAEGLRLRRMVVDLGIETQVCFPGWLAGPALFASLSRARALVVPSIVAADGDRDGIPNVVLEAMSLSLPVIASRLPGIAEAVEHDISGLLVPPADIEALAETIRALLDDDQLARRLGALGRERARQEFGTSTMVASMKTLLGVG